jgi:hypothetical protein
MRGIEDRSKSNFTHSVVLRLHPLDLAEINEADSFGDERVVLGTRRQKGRTWWDVAEGYAQFVLSVVEFKK